MRYKTKGAVMMTKYMGMVFAIVAVGAALLWFNPSSQNMDQISSKPVVSVSTFPVYEAARMVAGESMDVYPIVPLGTDAHLFNPNPQTVAKISSSAFFVYNGAGFESWSEKMSHAIGDKTIIIDMSRHVKLIRASNEEDEHDAHGHDEHGHEGENDPHFWLNIDNMIVMVKVFEKTFSEKFPGNASSYHKNAENYIQELTQLKQEFQMKLQHCNIKTLVSNHDAFGYLADANGFKNISVIGLSSDEQPSAKNIADIIELVKTEKIKTVFFEEFIDDHVAHTIAKEASASVSSLHPLENVSEAELQSHQTYLSIMRDNLAKLEEAMECH